MKWATSKESLSLRQEGRETLLEVKTREGGLGQGDPDRMPGLEETVLWPPSIPWMRVHIPGSRYLCALVLAMLSTDPTASQVLGKWYTIELHYTGVWNQYGLIAATSWDIPSALTPDSFSSGSPVHDNSKGRALLANAISMSVLSKRFLFCFVVFSPSVLPKIKMKMWIKSEYLHLHRVDFKTLNRKGSEGWKLWARAFPEHISLLRHSGTSLSLQSNIFVLQSVRCLKYSSLQVCLSAGEPMYGKYRWLDQLPEERLKFGSK